LLGTSNSTVQQQLLKNMIFTCSNTEDWMNNVYVVKRGKFKSDRNKKPRISRGV
jgi:hypothetical protein